MNMEKHYKRLSFDDRLQIDFLIKKEQSILAIATELNRSYSTIYRELKRGKKKTYSGQSADWDACQKATARRYNKTKLFCCDELKKFVYSKLKKRWSPEQISLSLRKLYPTNPSMNISTESIYFHIYVHTKTEVRKLLISELRQKRSLRGNTRRGADKRTTIKDPIRIDERPLEVLSREIPGHWEGDLVMGKNRESAIGTLVERSSRTLIIVPLKKRDAASVRKAFEKEFKRVPLLMKKSLTYDNGSEMAQHKLLAKNAKINVYFTHPYSPWERPTNENFNGLIRDYFPKGTDFSQVSNTRLKYVQNELNERPRKVLDMQTPKEVFEQLILNKI